MSMMGFEEEFIICTYSTNSSFGSTFLTILFLLKDISGSSSGTF